MFFFPEVFDIAPSASLCIIEVMPNTPKVKITRLYHLKFKPTCETVLLVRQFVHEFKILLGLSSDLLENILLTNLSSFTRPILPGRYSHMLQQATGPL